MKDVDPRLSPHVEYPEKMIVIRGVVGARTTIEHMEPRGPGCTKVVLIGEGRHLPFISL